MALKVASTAGPGGSCGSPWVRLAWHQGGGGAFSLILSSFILTRGIVYFARLKTLKSIQMGMWLMHIKICCDSRLFIGNTEKKKKTWILQQCPRCVFSYGSSLLLQLEIWKKKIPVVSVLTSWTVLNFSFGNWDGSCFVPTLSLQYWNSTLIKYMHCTSNCNSVRVYCVVI